MEFKEYTKNAMRSCNLEGQDKLVHGALGLCGESAEVADIVKKHIYQGHDININHLIEELGDVMWSVAEICDELHLDFNEILIKNNDKTKRRYPNGFEKERSVHREE